jgi:hypothetical protein
VAGYAELGDVEAKAGRLWQAFSQKSNPSYTDVEESLETLSRTVDALLGAHGVSLPVTDAASLETLKDLVATGATIAAVEAMFPGGQARVAADGLLKDLRADYDVAMGALTAGTATLVAGLTASTAAGSGCSDFWDRNEGYGQAMFGDGFTQNPLLAPAVRRHEPL